MSQHFSLAEFTHSDTALALHVDNSLPVDLIPNAEATLAMLERIRSALSDHAGVDVPITIRSGYRSLKVNAAVEGASTSDHLIACAADILAPAFGTPFDVCQFLAPRVSELGIGQLIHEFGIWVHVSTKTPVRPVNRVLTISHAGPVPGVVRV